MSFCSWGGEKYQNHFDAGIYVCSQCGHELFNSVSKFKHSSPWPAFTDTVHPDSVSKRPEGSHAYKVSCSKCDNGLGHEFLKDGPDGNSRFCIFSSALEFKKGKKEKKGDVKH
uniref:peptide-methionine (R)-S-oxide reductase n=1 Tax=Patiria miniata TaxID=46514 RepID=A0A914AK33_PATMI